MITVKIGDDTHEIGRLNIRQLRAISGPISRMGEASADAGLDAAMDAAHAIFEVYAGILALPVETLEETATWEDLEPLSAALPEILRQSGIKLGEEKGATKAPRPTSRRNSTGSSAKS